MCIRDRNGDASKTSWNVWNKLVLCDLDGNIEVAGHPANQNEESLISYILSNKGVNGQPHRWKMVMASYAGYKGVKSNGYETVSYTHLDVYKRQSPFSLFPFFSFLLFLLYQVRRVCRCLQITLFGRYVFLDT